MDIMCCCKMVDLKMNELEPKPTQEEQVRDEKELGPKPTQERAELKAREELKPISHKDFNEFIKGRGFANRNYYKLEDLKAMFGFKSLKERVRLVVSSEDPNSPMEPTHFNSMKQAAECVGVRPGAIWYAKSRGKSTFKKEIDGHTKVFFVKFC